ncbi:MULTISPECIES: DUF2987 domain-containing protein [unclassified Janthinobacterium]|uniref:DUF2987 domain-containing protein n=1 Tax=unclassified Janthinobacterium TaxID=2610881 RepID=UPI000378CFAB|nr:MULTISPECIES: DUF2987 domain-containing protein [unclassified Janthinobacterium]MEC5163016.1 hypothetical protein [Janthinobacterium sp. CG_S6]
MKKILLVPLFCLLHASAFAEDREWIAYAKLIDKLKLDKFYASPIGGRDKVTLYAMLTPKNKGIKPSDMVLTVAHSAGKQVLPITPEGKLFLVPNAAWIKEDAKIWTNLPTSEKVGVGFGMDALVPDGRQWRYSRLMGSVAQSNELIKTHAGMLSLLVPTIKTVVLQFPKPAQLTIQGKSGAKLYNSDAKNQIRLAPELALLQEDPLMLVSERPGAAELDTE